METMETRDQIVLFNGDGTCTPSDPMYGYYRTYIIDIDDRSHRRWLSNQYSMGCVMTAHKFINFKTAGRSGRVVHIPTKYPYTIN